ncbi:MAG TPA: ATPase domain-containing protein [Anaeromyxobacteraceae bacterium]|nr:ATPase domain-containing protein [Anaeromyxobacteraceae bacterium]
MSRSDEPRVPTGIRGLDALLGGGLPRRRLYLVEGAPGSGKTTLALQYLLAGAARGERCLYITLSETVEEVRSVARSHGWSLDGVAIYDTATQDARETETTLFQPSEVALGERMRGILREMERLQPSRVALDSCSELRLLAQSDLRYRHQILALKRELVERDRTVLLIDNPAPGRPDVLLQSLAHGVIALEQTSPLFGAERRRLRVLKMRGMPYSGGYHDFVIRTGGLSVFERLVAAEHPATPGVELERVSSGGAALDALLGGGPARGTSTLIMGPSGAGKSAVAAQYAAAAAARGEPVAIFAFDESRRTALARARSLGLDLDRHVESGRITVQQIDPAELTPGEFAHAAIRAVEERGVRLVVIDSLNGYVKAMPDESFLTTQLHELLSYLGQQGVLTFLIVAQHGIIGADLGAPADVSYLADTVLLLRYFEVGGGVRKALSVIKNRTGLHESTIRELRLGPGVNVGPPLEGFRGVLTGVPSLESPQP